MSSPTAAAGSASPGQQQRQFSQRQFPQQAAGQQKNSSQSAAQPPTPSPGTPSGIDTLTCQWGDCRERCSSPETLYDHICERHVGRKSTNNLNLQCQWGNCRTTTVKRDHITSHVRVHVPLKPHKCELCGKSFKRPQDLKKHVKTHADESVLLRTPPDVPSNQQRQPHAGGYQQNTLKSQSYYSTSTIPQTSYAYNPAAGHQMHYNPTVAGPTYGPVYYSVPQNAGFAGADYGDSKRKVFEALNQLSYEAKQHKVDPNKYLDIGAQFGPLLSMGVPVGGAYRGGVMQQPVMVDDSSGMAGAYASAPAMDMHSHFPQSFNALKTKNDLVNVDRFLESLQHTVYEHPEQAGSASAMAWTASSDSYPSPHHHSSMNSSNSYSVRTPELTPSSTDVPSHSPSSTHSSYDPSSQNTSYPPTRGSSTILYPQLPSVHSMTSNGQHSISSGPQPANLGPPFDDFDNHRRINGGYLQRSHPGMSSPPISNSNAPAPSESSSCSSPKSTSTTEGLTRDVKQVDLGASSPPSRRASSIASSSTAPTLPGVQAVINGGAQQGNSDAGTTAADPNRAAWLQNVRAIEKLREIVKGMLERGEFEGDAKTTTAEVKQTSKVPEPRRSLYPVLRPVEATS